MKIEDLTQKDVDSVNAWLEEYAGVRQKILEPGFSEHAGAVILAVADLARTFREQDPMMWEFCNRVIAQPTDLKRVIN